MTNVQLSRGFVRGRGGGGQGGEGSLAPKVTDMNIPEFCLPFATNYLVANQNAPYFRINLVRTRAHFSNVFFVFSGQVAAAQEALERGEDGAAERLAAAEEELERALEAVLDAECAGGGGFGGETQESAALLRVVVAVVVFLTSTHRHSLIVRDLMTGSSIVTTC